MFQWLEKLWNTHVYQKKISSFSRLLTPFSLLYMSLTWVKRTVTRLPKIYISVKNPVISIGNITVGGSGKTPLVMWLLEQMQNTGIKPVLITRGYKANFPGSLARRLNGQWDRDGFFGDELEMVLEKFPQLDVGVGKQRALLAQEFERLDQSRMLIFEDAYQYFRLDRDLDIVIIHCQRGFGNQQIFPAGPLREDLSGLRRAKVVILYQLSGAADTFLQPYQQYLHSHVRIFCMYSRLKNTEHLANKRVIALASIAWPQSFLRDLTDAGAQVVSFFAPGDHMGLTMQEQRNLLDKATELNCDWICMTAKDKPKWKIKDSRISVLEQVTEVEDGGKLLEIIQEIKKAP